MKFFKRRNAVAIKVAIMLALRALSRDLLELLVTGGLVVLLGEGGVVALALDGAEDQPRLDAGDALALGGADTPLGRHPTRVTALKARAQERKGKDNEIRFFLDPFLGHFPVLTFPDAFRF